jgi:hypothetical protein
LIGTVLPSLNARFELTGVRNPLKVYGLVKDTPNDVVEDDPSALVAVMVTVYGLFPEPDQLQVPFWLPL